MDTILLYSEVTRPKMSLSGWERPRFILCSIPMADFRSATIWMAEGATFSEVMYPISQDHEAMQHHATHATTDHQEIAQEHNEFCECGMHDQSIRGAQAVKIVMSRILKVLVAAPEQLEASQHISDLLNQLGHQLKLSAATDDGQASKNACLAIDNSRCPVFDFSSVISHREFHLDGVKAAAVPTVHELVDDEANSTIVGKVSIRVQYTVH